MSQERPPRPDPVEPDVDAVPETLREREQWIAWRYEWKPDRDEWTKMPVDANTGGFGSSTDPETWTTFDAAVGYHERTGTDTDGIGFVFDENGTVAGIDLDDCRDPDTGALKSWADDLLDDVETFTEISPSGTGLHLYGLGFIPDGGNRGDVPDAPGHVEMYDSGRFFTVTGAHLDDTPTTVEQVNDRIDDVHGEYIRDDEPERESSKPAGDGGVKADSPSANPALSTDRTGSTDLSDTDKSVLTHALADYDENSYLLDLWDGDWEQHTDRWKGSSHSEADMALCSILANYTDDAQQIDRLFRASNLYRKKWDRDDYAEGTIGTALSDSDSDTGDHRGAARPNEPGDDIDRDDLEPGEMNVALGPDEVAARAGLGDDEDVSDLTDREKAACVWNLVRDHAEFHVRVRRDNGSLWGYDAGVWKREGDRSLRHAAREALGSMNYGQNVLTELKAQARSDPGVEVEADEFGLEPGTIAVENGFVYLDAAAGGAGDDAIRDLRPEDYALTRLPVEYDPSADYSEWDDYVNEWAEDGYADALQEYIGYCLHVGGMPIHRALLLVGSGQNGKGTFLSVVRELLGQDNTSAIELQTLANEKDAVADFYGSLANIDDDLSARNLGNGLGMFKKLVAGDRVRGRALYEDGFDFQATGKHLYAANEVPNVNVPDEDEAFWRRWLLIEFPNHYPIGHPEREEGLRERLTEPDVLSGVLNWAIDGWARLLDQGHFTGEEQYAQAKRERWQAWGDSIDKFISECVERDPDAENLSTGDVHRVFAAWCRENDERPASQQKLTVALKNEDLDYAKRVRPGGTGTPGTGFKALTFTDDAPDLDDTLERETGQQQIE